MFCLQDTIKCDLHFNGFFKVKHQICLTNDSIIIFHAIRLFWLCNSTVLYEWRRRTKKNCAYKIRMEWVHLLNCCQLSATSSFLFLFFFGLSCSLQCHSPPHRHSRRCRRCHEHICMHNECAKSQPRNVCASRNIYLSIILHCIPLVALQIKVHKISDMLLVATFFFLLFFGFSYWCYLLSFSVFRASGPSSCSRNAFGVWSYAKFVGNGVHGH